jgi:methylenetetrahydrofolate reductase (NADPH)
MHIEKILKSTETPISFEFFPPRTAEGRKKLIELAVSLKEFQPAFASVTYGAGGSTRGLTGEVVGEIRQALGCETIPHLTCVGHSYGEVESLLDHHAAAGVGNILALRGDHPKSAEPHRLLSEDFPHAADLVRFIRRFNEQRRHPHPRGFGIGVAAFPEGHPGTPNRLLEMDHLKAKVDAGADYICTQFFFENRDFHDFRERCDLAGIQIPIVAGILPVSGSKALKRMAELAGGARFPARLLRKLQEAGGDETAERQVGIEYASEQCADLLKQKVAGIHLYTLNQGMMVREILQAGKTPMRVA